jgi:hypothetical protein
MKTNSGGLKSMVTWFIAGLVLYVALNKIRTLVPNFQVKRGTA